MRQAQKMEAVGMLAGGVAHDFNNLLTIISGYSQLILNTLQPGDPNHYAAEQILKAGERAATLTQQLLAFSRPQVLQPRVLDLNKLVTGLSTMLRRLIGEDIDLQLVLRPDLGMVSADPGQIEQVLMNLVVNARDAMPKGGTLTIETANVELDESYSGRHLAVKPGPYVLIAVSDNGGGMDEATQARLFEPFFTTKGVGRGTGLGLSTVFGIVKQSGGNLDVYSVPNRGTSVKVYLPRIDQRRRRWKPNRAAGMLPSGSETVLLVEDDEMVRHLVRETLVRAGYKVMDTSDPLEARRLSDRYQRADSPADHRRGHAQGQRPGTGRGAAHAARRHEGAVHVRLHGQRHRQHRHSPQGSGISAKALHPGRAHRKGARGSGKQRAHAPRRGIAVAEQPSGRSLPLTQTPQRIFTGAQSDGRSGLDNVPETVVVRISRTRGAAGFPSARIARQADLEPGPAPARPASPLPR